MARIRTVKPEFFRHELLQDLESKHVELRPMLVFEGLWTCCDKAGRFEWKPRHLKLDVLPFVNFDMAASMDLLRASGLIMQYEVSGRIYGHIPTFKSHQRITGKEAQAPEKYPAPPNDAPGSTGETPGCVTDAQGKGKGMEKGNGEEGKDCAGALGASPVVPKPDPTHPVPDSVDNRILCERVGIFGMREQGDMQKLYEAHCRSTGKDAEEAMEHMVSRWVEYQEIAPKLEWQYGSVHKFFMSGKWDDPRSWPRGKTGKDAQYAEFLARGDD